MGVGRLITIRASHHKKNAKNASDEIVVYFTMLDTKQSYHTLYTIS